MTVRTITLPAKRFEDFDDCLSAAEDHVASLFGLEYWQVSARWEDTQRDKIIVEIDE